MGLYGNRWDYTGPDNAIDRPYGAIFGHTGPYQAHQDHTGTNGTILEHARPYRTIETIWDHTGPYMR